MRIKWIAEKVKFSMGNISIDWVTYSDAKIVIKNCSKSLPEPVCACGDGLFVKANKTEEDNKVEYTFNLYPKNEGGLYLLFVPNYVSTDISIAEGIASIAAWKIFLSTEDEGVIVPLPPESEAYFSREVVEYAVIDIELVGYWRAKVTSIYPFYLEGEFPKPLSGDYAWGLTPFELCINAMRTTLPIAVRGYIIEV